MSIERGILDTNVVILLDRLDPASLPGEALITAPTLGELAAGPLVTSDDGLRADRLRHLQLAESDFEVLPFDASAARAFGGVVASLRRAGRKPAARTIDALIASIALAHGLPLFTLNPADFAGIDQLDVMPVTLVETLSDTLREMRADERY